MDKIWNGGNNLKTNLENDGKQICRGKGKLMEDINMWKFEGKPTLTKIQDQLQKYLILLTETVANACSILT